MSISVMGQLSRGEDCSLGPSDLYKSMFFQNGTAAVKVVYDTNNIDPNSITRSAASCEFSPTEIISGVFQKVQSCICSTCVLEGDTNAACQDISTLDLYSINTTSENNDCFLSKFQNECDSYINPSIGIMIFATLGVCIVGGIAYCCRSRITKCVASCRRDRSYQVLN